MGRKGIECFLQHTQLCYGTISILLTLFVCVCERENSAIYLGKQLLKSILHCFFASWKQVQRKAKIWHQAWGKEKNKEGLDCRSY